MTSAVDLLTAIQGEPGDGLAWLALADCLEEAGREREADLVRASRVAPLRGLTRSATSVDGTALQALLALGARPTGPTPAR